MRTGTDNDCTDKVVGGILSGWRYDISGLSPSMRKDYERHLAECARCRGRQSFHRGLDLALVGLTAALVFCSALAVALLARYKPMEHTLLDLPPWAGALSAYHVMLAAAALVLALSVAAFALVLTATPAPAHLSGLAAERVKVFEDSLPVAIKARRQRP